MALKKWSAYTVHLFTGSGIAIGMWALITIHHQHLQLALWLLAITAVIDSVDGTLARKFNTKKLAAKIDGNLLDNIIDYVTWTVLPLFWGYVALNIPVWVIALSALSSALGFSNNDAKTDDHFFKGFPSYWNLVILYCFLFQFSASTSSIILIICSILVFVPVKWVYPSRTLYAQRVTLLLGTIYILQIAGLLYYFNASPSWLLLSSLVFPVYYVGLSLFLNVKPHS